MSEQQISVPALVKRCNVLVYHGSLWHGGGANRTPERRIGIAMNHFAGFTRQQENQQLGVPRDVAARSSPLLQQPVGYNLYNGLVGHIDQTHPVELLGRHPDGALVWDLADGK